MANDQQVAFFAKSIFRAANNFPEERIRAKALDDVCSCMLSKPFDSRVLIECLATALGKTGA